MKNLVAIALVALVALVALLFIERSKQQEVPPENYGYSPPTVEDRQQLFGAGEERTFSQAAPHLFTNTK